MAFFIGLTNNEICEKLGLSSKSNPPMPRLIERCKKRGVIIKELEIKNDDNKKLYSLEYPDVFYEIPDLSKYTLISERITRKEFSEQYNYTLETVKASGEAIVRAQEQKYERLCYKYQGIDSKTYYDVYEKNDAEYKDLKEEIGKPCTIRQGFLVSNLGRVKNEKGELLKGGKNSGGYIMYDRSLTAHRMVLSTFDGRDDANDLFVDHINGIRSDNRLCNLRWVSSSKNAYYRDKNNTAIGEKMSQVIIKIGYEELNKIFDDILKG